MVLLLTTLEVPGEAEFDVLLLTEAILELDPVLDLFKL